MCWIKQIKYKLLSKGINNNLIEEYFYKNKEDLNEYEIIRIIQDCVKNNRIYTAEVKHAIIGTGKIGECVTGKEE